MILDTSFMFMEISALEQRDQAALAVIHDGVPIVEVARRSQTVAYLSPPQQTNLIFLPEAMHTFVVGPDGIVPSATL